MNGLFALKKLPLPRRIRLLLLVIVMGCAAKNEKTEDQSKEQEMKPTENEWIVLFDGSSMDQWHGYNTEEMPPEWSMENKVLKFSPGKDGGKNIVTNESFTNFVLSLEWKISEGGNSGIFWGVKEDSSYSEPYLTGPEIQLLDNERHPDALANPKYHQAGALYDLVQPSADVCNPAGEWNTCIITVDHLNNVGSVVLNGTQIVEFQPHGPEWDAMVAKSKFADWENFGKYRTGKIGLQDHGDVVFFQNIKIKKLPE